MSLDGENGYRVTSKAIESTRQLLSLASLSIRTRVEDAMRSLETPSGLRLLPTDLCCVSD